MIIRILLAGFVSVVSGVCFVAGLTRLMGGISIGFGVIAALFFGLIFVLPPGDERLSFVIHGAGAPWPFFLLALCLVVLILRIFLKKAAPADLEQAAPRHVKYLGGGLLLYLVSLFVPILFWFPSEHEQRTLSAPSLEKMVFIGVLLYLVGSSLALFMLYRASRGTTPDNPDLMRRIVPAIFTVLHLDKIPALVAYLLVFSTDSQLVFPAMAALGLAAYIPVALFLGRISFDCRSEP